MLLCQVLASREHKRRELRVPRKRGWWRKHWLSLNSLRDARCLLGYFRSWLQGNEMLPDILPGCCWATCSPAGYSWWNMQEPDFLFPLCWKSESVAISPLWLQWEGKISTSGWIFVPEETVVVTFPISQPKINPCLSKRMFLGNYPASALPALVHRRGFWLWVCDACGGWRSVPATGFCWAHYQADEPHPTQCTWGTILGCAQPWFQLFSFWRGVSGLLQCVPPGYSMASLDSPPNLLPGFGINIRGLLLPRDPTSCFLCSKHLCLQVLPGLWELMVCWLPKITFPQIACHLQIGPVWFFLDGWLYI